MPVVTEPFFLEGPRGRLFAVCFRPDENEKNLGDEAILHFSAFAEELNKSRRMVAQQARLFAEAGIAVLLIDAYGTGDSEGDFSELTWQGWQADMSRGLDWLRSQGAQRFLFWGLRLGALLAAEAAARTPLCRRLLFWAPVFRGDMFLTQFLRLRTAAGLLDKSQDSSVSTLKAWLEAGKSLEIGGYELNPALAEAIRTAHLRQSNLTDRQIDWIDVGGFATAAPSRATQDVLADLREAGCGVVHRAVAGEPFWSTPEITTVTALLEASLTGLAH